MSFNEGFRQLDNLEDTNPIDSWRDSAMYMHCMICVKEYEATKHEPPIAPRDYIHVEVARFNEGLMVWCVRHEKEVAFIPLPEDVLPTDENGCDCCD